jgi:hypothetical protein
VTCGDKIAELLGDGAKSSDLLGVEARDDGLMRHSGGEQVNA